MYANLYIYRDFRIVSVYMQFTLDKISSNIVLFTTGLLLVIPCTNTTNSAGSGVLLCQHVDQIISISKYWLLKPYMLALSVVIFIIRPSLSSPQAPTF